MSSNENIKKFAGLMMVVVTTVYFALLVFNNVNSYNFEYKNHPVASLENAPSQTTKTIYICGSVIEEKLVEIPINFTYAQLKMRLQEDNLLAEGATFAPYNIELAIPLSETFIAINYLHYYSLNIYYATIYDYLNADIPLVIAEKITHFIQFSKVEILEKSDLVLRAVLTKEEFDLIKYKIHAFKVTP